MSKLAQFLKSTAGAANLANPANPDDASGKISNFSNISRGVSENSFLAGTAAEPDNTPLSAAQEFARREVLAQLEADPNIRRAFVNRFEADGTMVVTLGIRDVGTGELKIPAERFNQDSLDDYCALLNIIGGAA
jgi:hypothetical protein